MPVVKTKRSACSHCLSMLFRYLEEKSVEHIMKIIFFHFLSLSFSFSVEHSSTMSTRLAKFSHRSIYIQKGKKSKTKKRKNK